MSKDYTLHPGQAHIPPYKSLQRLLRHSNIGTTLQIYSHVMEDDLRDDIEKNVHAGC